MEQLLAILLYLVVITSPNTYLQTEINQYEIDNQAQVDAVENDPVLLPQVVQTYGPATANIVVVDDWDNQ